LCIVYQSEEEDEESGPFFRKPPPVADEEVEEQQGSTFPGFWSGFRQATLTRAVFLPADFCGLRLAVFVGLRSPPSIDPDTREMHYVRLLRPPAVEQRTSRQVLKLVLAITTDLGDSYLSPQEPLELSVIGAFPNDDGILTPVNLTQNATPRWRAGMRVLKFDVPLPPQPIKTIQIRQSSRQLTVLGTNDVYPAPAQGLIMGVYADLPSGGEKPSQVCFRSLRLVGSDPSGPVNALQVEEDFGDSIARHIWDGGVVALSLAADLCLAGKPPGVKTSLPLLKSILDQKDRALHILELGCGVGIVGIGLSRILRASESGRSPVILMTDLPEAEERAQANISRYLVDVTRSGKEELHIDYENLDWQDGKRGIFGEKTQERPWDLVAVSECTYNTDTLLALVQTLSAIHSHSSQDAKEPRDTKIFLATKPRHSSEREAFDLLAREGWSVEEKTKVPLPMLDGNAQLVEMYLLSKS